MMPLLLYTHLFDSIQGIAIPSLKVREVQQNYECMNNASQGEPKQRQCNYAAQ